MYKLAKPPFPLQNSISVIRLADNASIPFDPDNTDYQQYLKFLEEGGQPLPADDNGQAA
jgi:hypothetical protein